MKARGWRWYPRTAALLFIIAFGELALVRLASSGRRSWRGRAPGVAAVPRAGRVGRGGRAEAAVTVLKAGADKPEVVAENPPLGERTAATPAIADDTLYVRTEKHLYAFGAR